MGSDHDCLAASLVEEILHRMAQVALGPETTEHPFELEEGGDRDRIVHRSPCRPPDEGGDGGVDPGDDRRHHHFLDVDTGLADHRHDATQLACPGRLWEDHEL